MPWDVQAKPVQPSAAIDWFRARLPITETEYKALTDAAKRRAFTLSGGATLETVQGVMDSLTKALEDGTPFDEWRGELPDALQKQWGAGGHRMRTTFDTAVQSAYGAGRWQAANDLRLERPVWGLEVVLDGRTSEICLALAGTVLPADDPFWKRHTPPLHFRCRTALVTYSSDQAAARGITPAAPGVPAQRGFGLEPGAGEWSPSEANYDPALWAAHQRLTQPPRPSDAISARLFGSPRDVSFDRANNLPDLERFLTRNESEITAWLGQPLTAQRVLDAAGLPNGANVQWVNAYRSSFTDEIGIDVYGSDPALGISELHRIMRIAPGNSSITNELLTFAPSATQQGIGTRLFAHQVEAARAAGFERIDTLAARSPDMNGYYTWVRLGYDAPVPALYERAIRDEYRRATGRTMPAGIDTFQKLFLEPGGEDVWKAVGGSVELTFDLSPTSISSFALNAYMVSRGFRLTPGWV